MGICSRTSASLFRSAKTGACMMNNLQLLTNQWDFFCKLKTNKSSATLALSGCYWPGIDLGVNPKKAQGGRAPELVLRTSSKMTARIEDRTQWNPSKRPAAACGLGCGDTETWTTAVQVLPMSEYRIISSVPALVRTCPLKEMKNRLRFTDTRW